jgi:hypothetical protein
MKKFIILLSAIVFLFSCTKIEYRPEVPKVHKPVMVENITYDSSGVIFKITNDINQGYNYQEVAEHGVSDWLILDTIYLKRFYSVSDASIFDDNYVHIGKGDYVCWIYNYEYTGYRNIYMAFKNPKATNVEYSYCIYGTAIGYSSESNWFMARFPRPVNDTVKVNLSSFFPELH